MGVSKLQTFIRKNVPNGFRRVNIVEECKNFRELHERQPVIVVDSNSLAFEFIRNANDVFFGGRYNVYEERALSFFERLHSLDAEFVFFADGPTLEVHIPEMLIKRNNQYEDAMKVIDLIDSGEVLPSVWDEEVFLPFFKCLKSIISKYFKYNCSILKDCDVDIVHYAKQCGALAIISRDTDFDIFEGKWQHWVPEKMNMEELTITVYDREALLRHTELTSSEMTLLASFMGNDITKPLVPRFVDPMVLSQHIRSVRSILNQRTKVKLLMEKLKLPSHSMLAVERAINLSINFYTNMKMDKISYTRSYGKVSLDMVSIAQYSRFVYVIIADKPYLLHQTYVDFKENEFLYLQDLLQPILKRTIGVLLYNFRSDSTRKFFCKFSYEQPYTACTIHAEYPNVDCPLVTKLIFTPVGKDPDLDTLRWKLLCWQISEKLDPNNVRCLQKYRLMHVLLLYYLFEKNQISMNEAECLLLATVCPPETQHVVTFEKLKTVNSRDARLTFLFTRLLVVIKDTITSVGLKEFCSLISFDGLLFHKLRLDMRRDGNVLNEFLKLTNFNKVGDICLEDNTRESLADVFAFLTVSP